LPTRQLAPLAHPAFDRKAFSENSSSSARSKPTVHRASVPSTTETTTHTPQPSHIPVILRFGVWIGREFASRCAGCGWRQLPALKTTGRFIRTRRLPMATCCC